MTTSAPTPEAILQTAFGFWNSKVFLAAVDFGLFTTLRQHRLTGAEIGKELALHPGGIADFLDALVAMKFLEREGDGAAAKHFNTPATALYLDRKSPLPHSKRPPEATRGKSERICCASGSMFAMLFNAALPLGELRAEPHLSR